MPIQFECPSCKQPIEVDDEIGGKAAACPYCQRVVTVPVQSTYVPQQVAIARPLSPGGGSEPPPHLPPLRDYPPSGELHPQSPRIGDLHVGPRPNAAALAAMSYGNRALVCAVFGIGFLVAMLAIALPIMMPMITQNPSSRPSQQAVADAIEHAGKATTLSLLQMGWALFSVLGLVFALVSLRQSRYKNWRGTAASIVCGLMLACGCFGVVLSAGGMGVG